MSIPGPSAPGSPAFVVNHGRYETQIQDCRAFGTPELWSDPGSLLDWADLFDLESPTPWSFVQVGVCGEGDIQLPSTFAIATLPLEIDKEIDRDMRPSENDRSGSTLRPDQLGQNPPKRALPVLVGPENAQLLIRHFRERMIAHIWSSPLGQKTSWDLQVDTALITLAKLTFMEDRKVSYASLSHVSAVLALSSKHIANGNKAEKAENWHTLGDRLYQEAQRYLQYSLQNEVMPKKAKYKDLVMAVSALLCFAVRKPRCMAYGQLADGRTDFTRSTTGDQTLHDRS